jgi:hypothetical protein
VSVDAEPVPLPPSRPPTRHANDMPVLGNRARRLYRRAQRRGRAILRESDSEPIEIFMGLISVGWSLSFFVDPRGHQQVLLEDILAGTPPALIGGFLFFIGAGLLVSILIAGTNVRRYFLYAQVFWWTSFAVGFGFNDLADVGTGAGMILAALAIWAAWRVRPFSDEVGL